MYNHYCCSSTTFPVNSLYFFPKEERKNIYLGCFIPFSPYNFNFNWGSHAESGNAFFPNKRYYFSYWLGSFIKVVLREGTTGKNGKVYETTATYFALEQLILFYGLFSHHQHHKQLRKENGIWNGMY